MIRRPPRFPLFPSPPLFRSRCDKIVFVDAPRPTRLRRLRETRGWSEEEVTKREATQMPLEEKRQRADAVVDRKSTRLNSSHANISYAVFCLKKKNTSLSCVS